MARHYLGFAPSPQLQDSAEQILGQAPEAGVDPAEIRRFFDLFVPELVAAYLLAPSEAVGVQGSMHRLVEGAASSIDRAWLSLLHRMIAKASPTAIRNAQHLIAEVYPLPQAASAVCGTPLPAEFQQDLRSILKVLEIDDHPGHREQLARAIDQLADLIVDTVIMPSIHAFEPGFLLRKICDATRALCRSASHQVLERVVRRLNQAQARRLDDFLRASLHAL